MAVTFFRPSRPERAAITGESEELIEDWLGKKVSVVFCHHAAARK